MLLFEPPVHTGASPSGIRTVNDVIVDQRSGLEELQRGACLPAMIAYASAMPARLYVTVPGAGVKAACQRKEAG